MKIIEIINNKQKNATPLPVITFGGPLYTFLDHAERDPEFISNVLYSKKKDQFLNLVQKRYPTYTSLYIGVSTSEAKKRKKNKPYIVDYLESYRIYRDPLNYSELYKIDLSLSK